MADDATGTETVSTGGIGPLIALNIVADDGTKIPLRGVSDGHAAVRSLVAGRLNPELPVLTYRVRGKTIYLTLRDLKLSP